MAATKRPRLTTLTSFAYQLNMWMEDGDHGLTFAAVYHGLETGTIRDVLKMSIPNIDVDLFLLPEWKQGPQLIATLREAADVTRGRERRKLGIERSGLALLMACVLEAIQQEWWEPDSGSRFEKHGANHGN